MSCARNCPTVSNATCMGNTQNSQGNSGHQAYPTQYSVGGQIQSESFVFKYNKLNHACIFAWSPQHIYIGNIFA